MQEKSSAIGFKRRSIPSVSKGILGIVLLMICVSGVFISASFWPRIYDETEGQYAGAAHEMLESGTWLVPTNDGIPRLQKPPVVYWIIRASLAVFGENDFAARLPNALATIGWIFMTYLLGVRVGGQRLGLFAAAIFSSMFGLFIFSHLIAPEPFLGLCLSLVFWCFLNAWQQPEKARRWFARSWVFMGLGVMVKGLHGALIPLAVAGLTALVNRNTRSFWRGLWSVPGLLLFGGMVTPWYAAIAARYPGFLSDHFVNEQIGHVVNKRWPPDCEQVPLGIFWLLHLIYFWPWILFVPAAARAWWQKPYPITDRVPARMIWTWILLILLGIMFSSRQDYYTMIAWGALAIWLALPWVGNRTVPRAYLLAPCLVLAASGGAVLLAVIAVAPRLIAAPASVTPVFEHSDLFKSVTGFLPGAWKTALYMIGGVGAVFLLGGAAGWALVRRNKIGAAGLVLAAMMLFPCAMVMRGYVLAQDYFSLAKVGAAVNELAKPGSVVVCEGEPHQNASLLFYFCPPVHWVGARPDGDFVQRALHIGANLYLTEEQLTRLWHSREPVYFILEVATLSEWQKKLGLNPRQSTPLARSGTRILLGNQPAKEFNLSQRR